jgi:hypothetical protein
VEEGVRGLSSGGLDTLWSGAAGAVLVALFTVGYTEVREARRRVRTCMGYAKLLDTEIEANCRVLEKFDEVGDMSWQEAAWNWLNSPPTAEVWTEVREPIVSLISPEDFDALNEYYRLLRVLLDLKEYPGANPSWHQLEHVSGVAGDLVAETPGLRDRLSRYARPSSRAKLIGF